MSKANLIKLVRKPTGLPSVESNQPSMWGAGIKMLRGTNPVICATDCQHCAQDRADGGDDRDDKVQCFGLLDLGAIFFSARLHAYSLC